MACDMVVPYVEVTAGALVRGAFRGELERLRFKGYRLEWHEDKGWINSIFTVKGDPTILIAIKEFADEMEAKK